MVISIVKSNPMQNVSPEAGVNPMSSVTVAYNIATFPGLVLNKAVQEYYVRKYDVPTKSTNVEEITTKIEEEKEKKGREDEFGEDTEDTVRRMKGEKDVYIDFYDIEEYEDVFLVTCVPFFVSSGTGFFFLLLAVVLSGGGVVYSLLPFWLGVAFAAHSFPNTVAADALWQKSDGTESRLRFLGYPIGGVSKVTSRPDFGWTGPVYALLLLFVAWYIVALA